MRDRKDIHRGRDWASSRWTVAEALDTLERIHDLGLCQGWVERPDLAHVKATLIPEMLELCENLRGQMSFVYADMVPSHHNVGDFATRWAECETETCLNELICKIVELSTRPPDKGFAGVILAASALKERLKLLDQQDQTTL